MLNCGFAPLTEPAMIDKTDDTSTSRSQLAALVHIDNEVHEPPDLLEKVIGFLSAMSLFLLRAANRY
jgi:hypothetical protein